MGLDAYAGTAPDSDCSRIYDVKRYVYNRTPGYIEVDRLDVKAIGISANREPDNDIIGRDFGPVVIFLITGLGPKPSKESLKVAAASAATWAAGVVASKSACYRIHLAYLNLKALENLGLPSGRGAFCKATGKLGKPEETAIGMPLIDHWCGRDGLTEWLDDFKPNVWEYRFQRCEWEKPDGRSYETPGLDYLVAYSELFKARLK